MSLVKSFATVGGATMASRILGFGREMLIASVLGVGPIADAFFAAFRFPNLFRRLFAEGAFNTAFIPLFSKELEAGGRKQAEDFAQKVFSVLFVVLLTITALAEMSMPFLVENIVAPRFGAGTEKSDLTILYTRIMFPYLLCMSLAAMLSGVLNALRYYFLAAFLPVLLNIVMISILLYCVAVGTGNTPLTGKIMSWGVFTAGFLQLGLVWYGVQKVGISLKISRPTLSPPVKRVLALAIPAAIANGITQINLLVGQIIASAQDGAIALLYYADRVYQLPFGVIGVAIGVVLLPELSRALQAGDKGGAVEIQNKSLEFALLVTLPAAAALATIPAPIVSVLYERGAFDANATLATAKALTAFAFGLPAFILVKVLSQSFFAREDMKRPMIYAGINGAVNIIASLALFPHFGHVGIAAATTTAAWVNVAFLTVALYRESLWSLTEGVMRRIILMILSSLLMGGIVYGLNEALAAYGFYENVFLKIMALAIMVTSGMASYFAICHISGAANLRLIRNNLKRTKKPKSL